MIHRDVTDGVALLRLEHGKVNALDVETLRELVTALGEVRAEGARAVVVTGEGRAFSAGVDLNRVLDGGPAYATELIGALGDGLAALFTHPQPVVAAVNGAAIAGGCILACAADRRLAVPSARIGATELTVGVPFPAAALEVLRHACGERTEEAVLSGRLFDGGGAVEVGMVHELVEPDQLVEAAVARAATLGEVPAEVYRLTKDLLRRPALARIAASAGGDPEVARIWGSPETAAAIRASMERTTSRRG
ncbi:MAG TPA: enoyl-CoA hydratase/isomerase family protein [Acidimicrobiales bacterium]|nr:enoyl-CoA hydratase/isomerase family protein [Acidimicrobiales bacterium]